MNNNYYFVRHGESEGNRRIEHSGTQDVPLTKKGIEQALELRKSITPEKFDLVYSSPLSRAFHTAAISLGKAIPIFNQDGSYIIKFLTSEGTPIIIDSRLCERDMGELEGISIEKSKEIPKYKGRKPTMSFTDRADGGENFRDVEKRFIPFLDELKANLSDKKILIFTHNGPLRLVKKHFENLSEEETINSYINNCGLLHYQD